MATKKTQLLAAATAVLAASVTSAAPVMPSAPNHLWLFDDGPAGSNVTAADTGISSTLTSDATISDGNPGTGPDIGGWAGVGVFGSANALGADGAFNARTGVMPTPLPIATTISLHFKWDGSTFGRQYLLDANANNVILRLNNGSTGKLKLERLRWNSNNTENLTSNFANTPEIGDTDWHHIAFVTGVDAPNDADSDANDILLYFDGVLVEEIENASGSTQSIVDFMFGNRDNLGDAFGGEIDEVAVWNKALTADEIDWLSQNSFVPEPSSLALLGIGGLLIARRRRA